MTLYTRTKRVTDPLDDRVKNRIIGRDNFQPGYVSSGSEHSAAATDSSPSLSPYFYDLLHCFGGADCAVEVGECNDVIHKEIESNLDSENESDRTEEIMEMIISIKTKQNVDMFRNILLKNVLKGIDIFQSVQNLKPNKLLLHRNIMLFLQNLGYNAAICKTKWPSHGGLTSGNYEFLDVIRSDSGERYYIDLNLVSEFEIARETNEYHRLTCHLPTIFVGKKDELKQIVKLMSDAARRSLKSGELLVPPWRKNRFMQNKWFGPYRRTVSYISANVSTKSTSNAVKCSTIGFNTVGNGVLVQAATRTG